jgi:beta-carotene 3-hydroxylase
MIRSILIGIFAFAVMEFVAYAAHRYAYHGLLWIFHKSHHEPRTGTFEWNDVFPVFFASVSIVVFWFASRPPAQIDIIAAGIGVTAYGMVYSFFHDIYIHRRLPGVVFKSAYLQRMKKAHMVHHASGAEPYGLLFFRERDLVAPETSSREPARPR